MVLLVPTAQPFLLAGLAAVPTLATAVAFAAAKRLLACYFADLLASD